MSERMDEIRERVAAAEQDGWFGYDAEARADVKYLLLALTRTQTAFSNETKVLHRVMDEKRQCERQLADLRRIGFLYESRATELVKMVLGQSGDRLEQLQRLDALNQLTPEFHAALAAIDPHVDDPARAEAHALYEDEP